MSTGNFIWERFLQSYRRPSASVVSPPLGSLEGRRTSSYWNAPAIAPLLPAGRGFLHLNRRLNSGSLGLRFNCKIYG